MAWVDFQNLKGSLFPTIDISPKAWNIFLFLFCFDDWEKVTLNIKIRRAFAPVRTYIKKYGTMRCTKRETIFY